MEGRIRVCAPCLINSLNPGIQNICDYSIDQIKISFSWNIFGAMFFFHQCLTCFLFYFVYFNCRLTTLQYCGGFCHTFTWISHGCTYIPHPDPPSHLPPHPIPQGHPSAPALSALPHALNWNWWSISHMIIYMFQCYSLKSSHPCLLPQSPKVCSLHLCLFCYRI